MRALDGRLSRKENERQRVSTRSTGTGSYVEFIDTALALANYAVWVKATYSVEWANREVGRYDAAQCLAYFA